MKGYATSLQLSLTSYQVFFGEHHRHTHINESHANGAGAPGAGHQHCQQATREPHWDFEFLRCSQQSLHSNVANSLATKEVPFGSSRQTSSLDRPAVVDGVVGLIFAYAAQTVHLYPFPLGAPALGLMGCFQKSTVEHACQAYYLQAVQCG